MVAVGTRKIWLKCQPWQSFSSQCSVLGLCSLLEGSCVVFYLGHLFMMLINGSSISTSFSLPRNPHLLLPAFWFLFLLTFLQISLVTRSPPRLPFSFYLCLRLLTFSSGYPDGVSLLISNVPPLSLYLLITDPPLSPPTPNPTPYEGEESELQPRRRWVETKQTLSYCCHYAHLKFVDLEMFLSSKDPSSCNQD